MSKQIHSISLKVGNTDFCFSIIEFFWHKNTCAMTQIEKEMQNVFSIMYEVKKKVFDRIQSFV